MDTKLWKTILKINLDSVTKALQVRKGWLWRKRNNITKIEKEYRQFLYLIATNPDETVVPWSHPLDDFWHEHILDTAKYSEDCYTICKKYIHHNPHLTKGTSAQKKAFSKTKKMHQEAFGSRSRSTYVDSSGCSGGFYPIFFDSGASCSSHHSSHSDSSAASCSSGHSSGDSGGGSSCGGGCGGD